MLQSGLSLLWCTSLSCQSPGTGRFAGHPAEGARPTDWWHIRLCRAQLIAYGFATAVPWGDGSVHALHQVQITSIGGCSGTPWHPKPSSCVPGCTPTVILLGMEPQCSLNLAFICLALQPQGNRQPPFRHTARASHNYR